MKSAYGIAAALVVSGAIVTPALAQSSDNVWTGPYVGIQAGGRIVDKPSGETLIFDTDGDGQYDDTVSTAAAPTVNFFAPGFCDGLAADKEIDEGCFKDKNKFDLAIHAGYDRQFGSIVVGLVAEYRRPSITDHVSGFTSEPDTYVLTRKLKDEAGLRLRAGVAANNLLFYVTGGAAYGRFSNSFLATNDDDDIEYKQRNKRSATFGYKAGAGVEQKLNQYISIGVQYLYTSLKPKTNYTVNIADGDDENPFTRVSDKGTNIRRTGDKFTSSVLSATINFRF